MLYPDRNPARYWRETVMPKDFLQFVPEGEDPDELFFDRMKRAYKESKEELARQLAVGATQIQLSGTRVSIYLSAIALLTYGYLDVVEDILISPPRPENPMHALLWSVVHIIPFPRDLKVSEDQADIIAWIKVHQQQLHWDELAGRFVLSEN